MYLIAVVYRIVGILSFLGLGGEFVQHQDATLFRSSSNAAFACSLSYIGKDNEILLSSTYEFTDVFVIMEGRSFE